MPPVGMTFSPLNAPSQGQPGQGPQSPLQDAIKLLSFKLPTTVGAGAPSGLLGPPTAAGAMGPQQGDGSMDNWLMQLLKGLVPDAGTSTPPQDPGSLRPAVQYPQATPPRVTGAPPVIPSAPDVQMPQGMFSYMHG